MDKKNSYKPSLAMINNAKRGLALREKYGRGGLDTREAGEAGVGSGVARARDIIQGNLSLDTVKRMYSFFSRHEKNSKSTKRESDGGPTNGVIAAALWGGSAGFAWARSILRQENILKSYTAEITEEQMNSEDAIAGEKLAITKSLNEEKRTATFLVLEPQDQDMLTTDLHLDWYDAEMVESSCRNFNKYCMKANILHVAPTQGFSFVESYITPAEFILGDKYVKKGSWLATIQVEPDAEYDWIWDGIKSGSFNGLSIQAIGQVEEI